MGDIQASAMMKAAVLLLLFIGNVQSQQRDYSMTICESERNGTCQKNNADCIGGDYHYGLCMLATTTAPMPSPSSTTKPPGSRSIHACCIKDCGQASSSSSGVMGIIGGSEATANSYPWVVHLNSRIPCGGNLISPRWILTAAHCVNGFKTTDITVTSGQHDLNSNTGKEKRHTIEKLIKHYKNKGGYADDIALIKLKEPVKMDDNRKMICLGDSKTDYTMDHECVLAGWGTGSGGKLNDISVSFEDTATCRASARTIGVTLHAAHLCVTAADKTTYKGACENDSGGPLMCKKGDTWSLVGVIGYGDLQCNKAGFPTFAHEVGYYSSWIQKIIKSNP